MWGEIVLALAPTVLEALGTNFIESRKKSKIKKHLDEIISSEFACFADTSLDCDKFYIFIKSTKFRELIRNYFFMVRDGFSVKEYKDNIEDIICEECDLVRKHEARRFIDKIESLYIEYLRKIVEDYPEIYAAFQLMSVSHRDIISNIRDSIIELKRYLETLENKKVTISDENIKAYHAVTEKEFGEIRFTGISGAERRKSQNINEFYVENTFSYLGKDIDKIYEFDAQEVKTIILKKFFDLGNKIVLIGGAGFGKTTTLNYLYCNYEKMYGANALKIKLDLKEYAEEIGTKKRGILWCLANEFAKRTKYTGLTSEQVQEIIADKLNDGLCLIILDALDEIPTQALRDVVRGEIEAFTSIYYLNRFIISTREAGYLKNRFDKTFLHIKINQFDETQIKKYSKNWYNSYYEDLDNFEDFWNNFYSEAQRARCYNLISNPIILVLALVIFDVEKNLPTRRIEFYQKCIETFLTERENRKAAFKLSEKTKSILAMNLTVPKIAFYKYNRVQETSGYRFNYSELQKAIMEAIDVEDEINWITSVNQFGQYLVERTELIREIDENNLDFAHKTFYEYFLAFYFSKMYESDDIVNLMYRWIGDANYDEMARLTIEAVIQNNEPKQHDKIINGLFDMLFDKIPKDKETPNKRDVFSVVADLYTHNLLQPKFHSKYNLFVLKNPQYVDYINFELRRNDIKTTAVLYDSKALFELFWKEIESEKCVEVLDCLKFLNNDFKKQVVAKDETGAFYRIIKLFSLKNDIKKKNDPEEEMHYFLNEGLEYTLNYPQVFVSILVLSLKCEERAELEKLMKYNFNPRDIFYYYTSPFIYFDLIDKSMDSNVYFALFLVSCIECTAKMANSLFEFAISNVVRKNNDTDGLRAKFCEHLWQILNYSNSYEEFKSQLINDGKYVSDYDDVYRRVFEHYVINEKGVHDEQLKKRLTKKQRKTKIKK